MSSEDFKFTYNMQWKSEAGTACSLTVRSDDLTDLVEESRAAMRQLGCDRAANGQAAEQVANGTRSPDDHWCDYHDVQLVKHTDEKAKDPKRREWYSHKDPDDEWCRGKAKSNY